jgi:hypothetical protein
MNARACLGGFTANADLCLPDFDRGLMSVRIGAIALRNPNPISLAI